MRLRLLFWVVVILAALIFAYLAVRRFGLIGGLILAPLAAGGAAVGAVAKSVGAKPVPKNESRPRRSGTSAVSPTPQEGKKRSRPRHSNWR